MAIEDRSIGNLGSGFVLVVGVLRGWRLWIGAWGLKRVSVGALEGFQKQKRVFKKTRVLKNPLRFLKTLFVKEGSAGHDGKDP